MAETIEDVDIAAQVVGSVDAIDIIPHQDVEQAAQDVVRAAVAARRREFIEDSMSSGFDADGVWRSTYMDTTTGDYYVHMSDGRYMNTTTGQEVAGDPTEVDASQYQWIIDEFTYFHERWPAYPRTMAEHCQTAKTSIQSNQMSPIVGVQETVANNWGGQASDDFHDFFLAPFVMNAITNQQALLDELALAMYAYEAVLRQGRLDARAVASETVNALDSVGPYGGGGDAELALGVLGVAVSVVSAVATGGTSLGITLGLIGAGVSAAQVVDGARNGDEPAEQLIGGETVDQILTRLREVLDDLRQGMDGEEEWLADRVEQTAATVRGYLSNDSPLEKGTILPNEPNDDGVTNLTSGQRPAPDEFRPRE